MREKKFELDTSREKYLCTVKGPDGKDMKCFALNPEKLGHAKYTLMKLACEDLGITLKDEDYCKVGEY